MSASKNKPKGNWKKREHKTLTAWGWVGEHTFCSQFRGLAHVLSLEKIEFLAHEKRQTKTKMLVFLWKLSSQSRKLYIPFIRIPFRCCESLVSFISFVYKPMGCWRQKRKGFWTDQAKFNDHSDGEEDFIKLPICPRKCVPKVSSDHAHIKFPYGVIQHTGILSSLSTHSRLSIIRICTP